MAPPAVVYVVAAVMGVAAVFAFKEVRSYVPCVSTEETRALTRSSSIRSFPSCPSLCTLQFVYEPHIAPTIEAWAEDFLERRRAARERRASAVPVRTSRRRTSSSSSVSSLQGNHPQRDEGEGERAHGLNDLDAFELEALASREVDEWRNEVLRSQDLAKNRFKKAKSKPTQGDFDGFESTSTTLDESFASLTHTPLASTHVISNVSSPITPSTVSLPQTPTRRLRSVSQSTTQGNVSTSFIALHSPPSPIHEIPVVSPRAAPPGSGLPTPRPPTDSASHFDTTPSLLPAIAFADRRSPTTEGIPHLPFTPTCQVMADDSPFGPLLPDTSRSSAEMYGERPFSPIMRVMEPSSSSVSTTGSKGTLSSMANSASSIRTLGSSGVLRKPSGLANELVSGFDDDSGEEDHPRASSSTFTLANSGLGANGSVISSLSERYPAPPTPPEIISPPASSIGIISAPSSPRSGSSEVVVHHDALTAEPHASSPALPQTRSSLPTLQVPPESWSPLLVSRSQSSAHSAMSPALSYASFLSPMPVSRTASESEGDEFMSIASGDSDWSVSPVTPGGRSGPVQERANNPFLDFEHLTHDASASRSEHGGGSEGSEVLVSYLGQEGGSEAGSEESWGSVKRH
ncbi:hypothetical protein JVT61DRAFT_6034 [Boletus reticuloceps]|uniref:Uncharacterized protein n=1 Tax=Boletus reticuloceps TaxID=495285 RepID=A0A8I3A8H0_9AGAM|nr:hypothetical protein JVT61DRAFT_6034 [Boletus reticuloceps]